MKVTFERDQRERFKSGEFPGLFAIHYETQKGKYTAGGPVTEEELDMIRQFFLDFHKRRQERKSGGK